MNRYIIAFWQIWLPHSETAFADYRWDERFFAGISLSFLEMDRKQAVADLEMAIKNSERNVESLEHNIREINETLNRIMRI